MEGRSPSKFKAKSRYCTRIHITGREKARFPAALVQGQGQDNGPR